MKWVAWAAVLVVGAVAAIPVLVSYSGGGSTKEGRALDDCQLLVFACERYREQTGKYPESLHGLTGRLEQGEDGIIDPWGNPYRYEVAPDEKGVERPYVWAEHTAKGRTRVIGTRPRGR